MGRVLAALFVKDFARTKRVLASIRIHACAYITSMFGLNLASKCHAGMIEKPDSEWV